MFVLSLFLKYLDLGFLWQQNLIYELKQIFNGFIRKEVGEFNCSSEGVLD